MITASPIILGSTMGFLWNKLCFFWPFALLGLLCGLGAAWWLWYRSARVHNLRAERETERLTGSVQAYQHAMPRLESHQETLSELQELKRHTVKLKSENERTRITLADRDTELAKAKGAQSKASENERLQASQLAALQENIATLTGTLKSRDSEVLSLKTDADRGSARAEANSEKVDQAMGKVADLEDRVCERDKEIARLKERATKSNRLLEEQKQLRLAAESTQNGANKEIEANRNQLSQLQEELASKQEALADAEVDRDKQLQETTAAENKLAGKERVIAELQKALAQNEEALASEAAQRKSQQSTIESEWSGKLNALHADFSTNESELDQLRSSAKAKDAELANLKKDASRNRDALEAQEAQWSTTQSDLESEWSGKLNALQASFSTQESELNQLRSNVKAKDSELADLKKDASRNQDALDKSISDLTEHNKQCEAHLEKLKEFSEKVESLELEKASLEDQKQTDTARLREHEAEARKLHEELAQRQSSLEALKTKLGDTTVKDEEASALLAKQDHEMMALSKALESSKQTLNDERASWDAERRNLRRQLAEHATPEISQSVQEPLGFASFQGEDVKVDEHLGTLYQSRPDQTDDLKKISGVGGVLEGKLNGFGVYRFKQVALWEPAHENAFSDQLSFPDRIQRDQWKAQAAKLHFEKYGEDLGVPFPATSTTTSTQDDEPEMDPELGMVYQRQPKNVDDLKEISGVASMLEEKLNNHGVYKFKQVALWNDAQVETFSSRLSFKDRIEREDWRPQAARLHLEKYGENLLPSQGSKGDNRWDNLSGALFAKETSSITVDQEMGILYTVRPNRVDDLKRISGVAETLERKLQANGVYRFKQIATWDKSQIEAFSERLSFKDRIEREEWVRQAANLHFEEYGEDLEPYMISSGEDAQVKEQSRKGHGSLREEDTGAEADPSLGIVYRQRPRKVDDLTRIKGVAQVLEAKLHSIGVYRFKQIAQWTPEQVAAFSEKLSFKGRIEREEWLRQATELHAQEYGEKLSG